MITRVFLSFFGFLCLFICALKGLSIEEAHELEARIGQRYPRVFRPEGMGYSPQVCEAMRKAKREALSDASFDIRSPALFPCVQKLWDAYALHPNVSDANKRRLCVLYLDSTPSMLEAVELQFRIAADLSEITPGDLSITSIEPDDIFVDAQGKHHIKEEPIRRLAQDCMEQMPLPRTRKAEYKKNRLIAFEAATQAGLTPLFLPLPKTGILGTGDLLGAFLKNIFLLPCPEGPTQADGCLLSPLGLLSHDANHAGGYNMEADSAIRYKLIERYSEHQGTPGCGANLDFQAYCQESFKLYGFILKTLQDFYVFLLESIDQDHDPDLKSVSLKALTYYFILIHEYNTLPKWNEAADKSFEELLFHWCDLYAHSTFLSTYTIPESNWLLKTWAGFPNNTSNDQIAQEILGPLEDIERYSVVHFEDRILVNCVTKKNTYTVLSRKTGQQLRKALQADLSLLQSAGIHLTPPDLDDTPSRAHVQALLDFLKILHQEAGTLYTCFRSQLQAFLSNHPGLNATYAQLQKTRAQASRSFLTHAG